MLTGDDLILSQSTRLTGLHRDRQKGDIIPIVHSKRVRCTLKSQKTWNTCAAFVKQLAVSRHRPNGGGIQSIITRQRPVQHQHRQHTAQERCGWRKRMIGPSVLLPVISSIESVNCDKMKGTSAIIPIAHKSSVSSRLHYTHVITR